MNELRWILLAAGLLLILGVYFWGWRSRGSFPGREARHAGPSAPQRVEDDRVAADANPRDPGGGATGWRREPSLSIDDPAEAAATGRREPTLDLAGDDEEPAIARRARAQAARADPLRVPPRIDAPAKLTGTVAPVARPEAAPAPRAVEAPAAPREAAPAPSSAPAPAGETATSGSKGAGPAPSRSQKIIALRVSAGSATKFSGATLRSALEAEGLRFGRYDIFHRLHADGRPVFSVASLREPGTFDLELMAEQHYPGIALFTVLPGPVPAADAVDALMLTARTLAIHLGGAMADERGVPVTTARLARLREEAIEFELGQATD